MAKGVKKRGGKVGRRAARPGAGKFHSADAARNASELLIRKMLASKNSGERQLLMQDMIYNMSGKLKTLAYESGFELGVAIYENSDKTIGGLERTLEDAGFGRVLYRPFESRGTISSYKVGPKGKGLGADVHAFEAGLIAGYLSAHAGRPVHVRESKCTYNGSEFCEFVATPKDERPAAPGVIDLEKATAVIRENVAFRGSNGTGSAYGALFTKPLLVEPVFAEASKLMYMTGKRLAGLGRAEDFGRDVVNIARYLGIEGAKVRGRKPKGIEIDLTYGQDSSVGNFVDLTTAMLAGYARGVFNKNVYVQRRLTSKRKYSVKMRLLPDTKKSKNKE
jgi:hypothetical protein